MMGWLKLRKIKTTTAMKIEAMSTSRLVIVVLESEDFLVATPSLMVSIWFLVLNGFCMGVLR